VAGARRSKEGSAAITAEGNEVEIAASIKALQTVAHEKVWDNAKSKRSSFDLYIPTYPDLAVGSDDKLADNTRSSQVLALC